MRTRSVGIILVATILLAMPMPATAGTARTYHGTWDTAGWAFDESTCPLPPSVPATGNWNVTIQQDGRTAVVHSNLFTLGMHVDAWGGHALGDFWTVDAVTPDGFALHLDMTGTPLGSWNTFVLDHGTLTFTISPWIGGPFVCRAAVATGA
jgi:hypothetical protein